MYSKNCLELEKYFLCSNVAVPESQIDDTGWNSEIPCQVHTAQSTTNYQTESSTKATSHSDTSSTAVLTTGSSTKSTTKPTEAITVPTSQPTTALMTEQMLFINAITHYADSSDNSSSPTRYEATSTTESLKIENGRPLLKEDTQDNPEKNHAAWKPQSCNLDGVHCLLGNNTHYYRKAAPRLDLSIPLAQLIKRQFQKGKTIQNTLCFLVASCMLNTYENILVPMWTMYCIMYHASFRGVERNHVLLSSRRVERNLHETVCRQIHIN